MFNIECILYLLIILYSLFYQLYVITIYRLNKKIKIKDATGLYIAKDILNKNNLGSLYVTKISGKYNDHYDIERNVIRLSEEVYEKDTLASVSVGFYEAIKAIATDKDKRKEEKIRITILDWLNKIFFILFILGASSKALDVMTLSLIVMAVVLIMRYNNILKKSEYIEENINYIKKEYKLKKDVVNKLKKNIHILLYNELSLHIFNNRY